MPSYNENIIRTNVQDRFPSIFETSIGDHKIYSKKIVSRPVNILFIVPYPLQKSPSQRFRFEQYFEILKAAGHHFNVQTFLNSRNWQSFLKPGNLQVKVWGLAAGFLKRFSLVFTLHRYDFVFIHREASPIGPPIFEWLFAKIFRKKIIYDFDDAIWTSDRIRESTLFRIAKWRSKVRNICAWSYRVSCGNQYLCDFARRFNPHATYNPTTIDTSHHQRFPNPTSTDQTRTVIGWTGSSSTVKYLQLISDVLKDIESQFPEVDFYFIADKSPELPLARMKFIPWRASTEIEDLSKFDIGIMPLPDDEWSKGKCGFKLLQYFALEIPAVASNVGANTTIVNENSGFLCTTDEHWFSALSKLISDRTLRNRLGKHGKEQVEMFYSVASNKDNFLSLFA